jgi:hypothetical protein
MVSTDGVLRHLVGMRAKYMLLDYERSDEAGSEGRADLGTLRSGMHNAATKGRADATLEVVGQLTSQWGLIALPADHSWVDAADFRVGPHRSHRAPTADL